jgi:hypothetical protein
MAEKQMTRVAVISYQRSDLLYARAGRCRTLQSRLMPTMVITILSCLAHQFQMVFRSRGTGARYLRAQFGESWGLLSCLPSTSSLTHSMQLPKSLRLIPDLTKLAG